MTYTPISAGFNERTIVNGVPFHVTRTEGQVDLLPRTIDIGGQYACLYFLGMSIRHWEMSEWWGQQETRGDLSYRVFLGDTVAKLFIEYEDDSLEVLPVILGVNCWQYDTFFGARPWEKNLVTLEAPYFEPMSSDPEAQKLWEASMRMQMNPNEDWEKGTRWIYVHKVRSKPIRRIDQRVVAAKGVCISAVTGCDVCPEGAPDEEFYLRRDWFADTDRFARYIYQYRDELPGSVEILPTPAGSPEIEFGGSAEAEIFTNVYRKNIEDMAFGKVTDDGKSHTSSMGTLNFGSYVGFGMYRQHANYFNSVCSRDIGRTLIELSHFGYGKRTLLASGWLHELLYYPSTRYPIPHWKFDADKVYEKEHSFGNEGLCNDGHASFMMAMYSMYQKGWVGMDWLRENEKHLKAAGDFYLWQITHPQESHFDRVLYSTSECSTPVYGGYDLYSNAISVKALECYARMFTDMGDREYAAALTDAADRIRAGLEERFTQRNPHHGEVYVDTTHDCWTYEYKRFCYALMASDMDGYDLFKDDPALFDKMERTFEAQRDEYYHPESGRQMGYGQGYLTLAALILDKYDEYSDCMDAIAHECYHHHVAPYIVPEGVVMDAQRKRWSRNSDLGNGVQQAEIVKCTRLLTGLDDLKPGRAFRIVPRLPRDWSGIRVRDFMVRTPEGSRYVSMRFERVSEIHKDGITALCGGKGYHFVFTGAEYDTVRMGPFDSDAITVTGAEILDVARICGKYYVYVK